jgi:hypothetical protein
MTTLRIEPTGAAAFDKCACCGNVTERVWGLVYDVDAALAAYFVTWTRGHIPSHGATLDLVIGAWGNAAKPGDRNLVCLEFRTMPTGPGFGIVDAESRAPDYARLAAQPLKRAEVIGTPLAATAFAIVDAIWVGDDRIEPIRAS